MAILQFRKVRELTQAERDAKTLEEWLRREPQYLSPEVRRRYDAIKVMRLDLALKFMLAMILDPNFKFLPLED